MQKTIRAEISAGLPPIVFVLEGDKQRLAFVDAAWGILQFLDNNGREFEMAFTAKYRSQTSLVGPFEKTVFRFDFGNPEGFSVEADGKSLKPEDILRLCFFARTDFGVALVSFYPAMVEDAQEYVAVFSKRKNMRVLAQHFAVSWLHEIWGQEADK